MNKENHKEYAQNLSHELLTPLAIIRSKVEVLLQSSNLSEADLQNLDGILQTVNRMSKLNKALILLSKLDNNVFVDSQQIDLIDLISDCLENFEDQIRLKELTIRFDKVEVPMINSNFNLVQILFTNLIKNAVIHNRQNGMLQINCTKNSIAIINSTDKDILADPFQRFQSKSSDPNSVGLGLSIVQKICDSCGFKFEHLAGKDKFEFTIFFP